MKLVLIPPGEFQMGSPKELIVEELRLHGGDDAWYRDHLPGEGPQHRVRITKPYWMGATHVTQEEYLRVMGSNPSKFQGDPKRPVEQVSWNDAVEFCRRLSELPAENAAKRRYELPTEAQWEYACRAGTTTRWYSRDDEAGLVDVAWFNTNSSGQPHPVGQKMPNAWALYDMHGNVFEWCQDWYDRDYYKNVGDRRSGRAAPRHRPREPRRWLGRASVDLPVGDFVATVGSGTRAQPWASACRWFRPTRQTTARKRRTFTLSESIKSQITSRCIINVLSCARYEQKWSQAAKDLAKVIELESG